MRFGDLARAARIYVAVVCGLALCQALCAAWFLAYPAASLELFVLLSLAAAWAHGFPVSSPYKQSYQLSLPFVVAAIALLAPAQLVGLIVFVHLADWLGHRHLRSRFALGFNTGVFVIAALTAQVAYHSVWWGDAIDLGAPQCLLAGLVAAATFGGFNRLLLTGAIWLTNRSAGLEHLFEHDGLLTDAVLLAMGLPLAQLAVSAPWAAAVASAPLWLIHRALDLPNERAQRRQDGLTELFTAPYLTETCTRELNRARRFSRQTVLLLLDADGLGHINEQHGQAAGDAVLRSLARSIKRAIREYDLAARLAGGLFAVLLPETDLAQAQVVAERVRRDAAAAHHEVPHSIEQVPLTVSIGGVLLLDGAATASELFEAARASLGRAKRDGGNKIEFTTLESARPAAPSALPGTTVVPLRARAAARGTAVAARSSRLMQAASAASLAIGGFAVVTGAAHLLGSTAVADWRLLAMLGCVAALAGLGFTFRTLTVALAFAFELHISSARAAVVRYWRLWPMYVALLAVGFVVAYAYQRFGLPVALGVAFAALGFRQLAGHYIDRTFESVRTLRTANQQLEHRAFHDPLTGLANRALFAERLEHALVRSDSSSVAVLFLDLDNFKPVNDTLGHAAGDALLIAAAQRLLQCVRREDSIARLGGDEFTVLLENMRDPSDAARLAERIGESLAQPFEVAGQAVFVSSSIGIALDTDRSHAPDDLLREADMAMYRAKSGGKARYEIFDTGMGSRAMERLELETDLRHAAARGELVVQYARLVDVVSRAPSGLAATLEWHHPRRGVLAYADFGAVGEESGIAVELGRWLLRAACRDAVASGFTLYVRVSQSELDETDFVESVTAALALSGLLPERLCLAVPETALGVAGGTLERLAGIGVTLAVDGLGSGSSSLDTLTQSPVRMLKLAPDAHPTLARATLALADALAFNVIGESATESRAAAA